MRPCPCDRIHYAGCAPARHRSPAAPPGTTLDWQAAETADLPFPDTAFDVAFCQQGLQFVADTLRGPFVAAGFRLVHVAIEAKVCRYPSPAELVRLQELASPIGEPLGQLHERERTALVADLDNVLAAYQDDDGLAMPMESHVVLAQ